MYSVGDLVVHPKHGAGVISAIVNSVGDDGVAIDYYIFEMTSCSMRVMIPADAREKIGMRPIMDRDMAEQILLGIEKAEIEQNSNWNRRYRDNMEKVKSGCLSEVGYVIKALTMRDKLKGLSTGERKLLNSAKRILLSELEYAFALTPEEAEEKLNCAL